MNRNSSEWGFQRFLLEASSSAPKNDVVEINDFETRSYNTNLCVSEEYLTVLKSRLNLACAAVALSRSSTAKPRDDAVGFSGSNGLSQLSQASRKGSRFNILRSQDNDAGEKIGVSSLPFMQKKSGSQVRPTMKESSIEQSEDEECDGETDNMDPADSKRIRRMNCDKAASSTKRMLSNRESARRSRSRKQAHLTELETQVSQLRDEKSSLLKRFSDISQKYNESAVDNRILKADVETLRAKVEIAEEWVRRITGNNPLLQTMSDKSSESSIQHIPLKDEPKFRFYHFTPDNPIANQNQIANNALADISSVGNVQQNAAAATASMQHALSLEHLQTRIRSV